MLRTLASGALVLVLMGCQAPIDGGSVTSPRPGAAASAGCASPARLPPIVTVQVDGSERKAAVRGNETLREPQPLVLVFHGYGDAGRGIEVETDYSRLAAKQGFMAVFPRAVHEPPSWEFATDADIEFAVALLASLEASLCIDTNRIFATGMSMGGGMANLLGCRLSRQIAAIAPVAGTYGPHYADTCEPDRAVPVLAFHALEDHVVPYQGGPVDQGRIVTLPPVIGVEPWADAWANRNGCRPEPTEGQVPRGVLLTWQGCDAEVQLYRLDGGGHTWPGGPSDPHQEISASDLIWDFFSHQVLPPAR